MGGGARPPPRTPAGDLRKSEVGRAGGPAWRAGRVARAPAGGRRRRPTFPERLPAAAARTPGSPSGVGATHTAVVGVGTRGGAEGSGAYRTGRSNPRPPPVA